MLFARFGPLNFPAAPNQHQPFCDLREELGDTCPPSLPVRCFLIHSKTACRGFKSFCPCQKSQVSLVRYLTFFVSVRKDLATRCARRLSCGACRGALVACGDRPAPTEAAAETSPSAPAKKPAKTLGFRRFSFCMCCMVMWFTLVQTLAFSIRFYPFSTVLIPSSTQNAPSFAFFGLFRVRFPLFCCFPAAKFLPWFLCILPHSVYKLKPSVIPCRREVSFFT